MTPQTFSVVHGHTIEQLEKLLIDACPFLDSLRLRPVALGGWTHINILGFQEDQQFVVKFPAVKGETKSNPFEYQFRICEQLQNENICPEPLILGNLSDSNGTPFMITRFVSGTTHSSVSTFCKDEIKQLITTLNILNELKLRNLQTFNTPSEMLDYFLSQIQLEQEPFSELPYPLRNLITQNQDKMAQMHPILDILSWTLKPIHGDLTESNIVFTDNKAILLDFEACCKGPPIFDITYFYNQFPDAKALEFPELLRSSRYSRQQYIEMFPLVLVSVIAWTINRLIDLELNNIEPNFDNVETKELLNSYLIEKSKLLSSLV